MSTSWDDALDAAMDRKLIDDDLLQEEIDLLLEEEVNNPFTWFNFNEALSNEAISDKDKEEFEMLFQSGDIKALKMLRKISIDFWTSVVLPTAEINLEDRDF